MKEIDLYHGSGNDYENPSMEKSRETLDFGKGYYLTTDEIMSKKWASNKDKSYVYKYYLDIEGLNIYYFNLDSEWLDFVISNRRGNFSNKYDEYDVLVGAIANDKMYSTISSYEEGYLTKEQTIRMLNIGGFSEQFVIKNEKTLRKLKLVSKYVLKGEEKEEIINEVRMERIKVSKMIGEFRRQEVIKADKESE